MAGFPLYQLDRIAVELADAAWSFAVQAQDLETTQAFDSDPNVKHPERSRHRGRQRRLVSLAATSVIMSVTGWEARLNELLQATEDTALKRASPTWRDLPEPARQEWPKFWRNVAGRRTRLTLLERSDEALRLAGIEPIPRGEGIGQAFSILMDLRDALVHAKPALRRHGKKVPLRDLDPLEAKLRNRFEPSAFAHVGEAYLWRRCLGAGCAKWAVNTAEGYASEFVQRLGLTVPAPDLL